MPNLYLKLKHMPENLPAGNSMNGQAWGYAEFIYDDGFDQIPLLTVDWQLKEFARWFILSHIRKLYNDFGMKLCLNERESIAQAFARLQNQNVRNNNGFLAAHSLRSAFFYSKLCPEIFLGLRSEPHEGEISLAYLPTDYSQIRSHAKIAYPEPEWAYRFDLTNYRQDARFAMLEFVEEWYEIAPDKYLKEEAASYLRWLINVPE